MMNMIEASKGLSLVVMFKWMASGGAVFVGIPVVLSMMLSQL